MRPMSRSIEGRASSRRGRASSAARSAGEGPAIAGAATRRRSVIVPGSACFRVQRLSAVSCSPNSFATATSVIPHVAHPLHRLAPCAPRGAPAAVSAPSSRAPSRPADPSRSRQPNQGGIKPVRNGHEEARHPCKLPPPTVAVGCHLVGDQGPEVVPDPRTSGYAWFGLRRGRTRWWAKGGATAPSSRRGWRWRRCGGELTIAQLVAKHA